MPSREEKNLGMRTEIGVMYVLEEKEGIDTEMRKKRVVSPNLNQKPE